jgi:molybdopterin converting factor small subunit
MLVTVCFYSYFKDLTGCATTTAELAEGSTLGDLFSALAVRFPELGAMRNATLMAVGVNYQDRTCVLRESDEVSLFPPVQGG